MRWLVLVALVSCSRPEVIEPTAPRPLPVHREIVLDSSPKQHRRMMPPEVFLRAYLTWFGGLVPSEVQQRAKGANLFDQWNDYLGALGLPDYRIDVPRTGQSNTIMLAAIGRLGEALCFRAAEHDLGGAPPEASLVFAFDAKTSPTADEFAQRFDILHRLFLGYPARLAPDGRTDRFYALYQKIAAAHTGGQQQLSADAIAWATICTALVQHPEAELY